MNHLTLALTRPWVRLRRLPHRQGYGVHSPFAFEYITRVVLEHTPYYIYRELEQEEADQVKTRGRSWAQREPRRVKRLLMRVANRARPSRIVDVGACSSASIYLLGGRRGAEYLHVSEASELEATFHALHEANTAHAAPDSESYMATPTLTYLHDHRRPELMRRAFCLMAQLANEQDVMVVEGIGYSPAMRRIWSEMQQDPRTGITIDLHDLGIIFMDHHIRKQHYVVSF